MIRFSVFFDWIQLKSIEHEKKKKVERSSVRKMAETLFFVNVIKLNKR